jgi:Cys-rich protein (TIGR01571 family)
MASLLFVLLVAVHAESAVLSADFEECEYDACDDNMYLIQKKIEVGVSEDQLLLEEAEVKGRSHFLPGVKPFFVAHDKADVCKGNESMSGAGMDYRGCQTITQMGLTCQKWTSQTPNTHSRTPDKFPHAGLDFNFCRNPDGMPHGPWCYVTDGEDLGARWDYCDPMVVVKKYPTGWEKVKDKNGKQMDGKTMFYYFNPRTGEVSWTEPPETMAADHEYYGVSWKWPWQRWQWDDQKYSFGTNAVHYWDAYFVSSLCTWLIWALLVCLIWFTKYPAEPDVDVLGDPVNTFERGHFSCMKNKHICACSFLCPVIQFADNQHLGGSLKGHVALFMFLACGLLNDVTMSGLFVCGLFTSILIIFFRQKLRQRMGLEPWSLNTIIDIFYVCCCPCCAIAQEALVVQYSYNRWKDGASRSPRVVMSAPIIKMPRSRSPSQERAAGTTVIREREAYRSPSPGSHRSLSNEPVATSTFGAAFS